VKDHINVTLIIATELFMTKETLNTIFGLTIKEKGKSTFTNVDIQNAISILKPKNRN
jgi:hypothetical protein